MNKLKNVIALTLILILSYSCSDDLPIDTILGDYQSGYFIVNEGPFSSGSGTLTFVNNDGVVAHNVYKNVNNEDLGSIVQSMTLYGSNAYVVINNSHKMVIANRYTMEKISIIEGDAINNPRYFVAIGDTGYISNWGDPVSSTDDFIAVVDLTTNTITATIPVGEGAEKMLISNGNLYVNLKQGWGQNNQLAIINTTTNTLTTTLTVGDVPTSILKDANDAIWVLCSGKPSFVTETTGSLLKIENDQITSTFTFNALQHPNHLTISANQLYYTLNGKVYSMLTSATALNSNELSGFDGNYSSITANGNYLYTTNAGDFASEGTLKIFNTNTTDTQTITTGIIPNSVVFQ